MILKFLRRRRHSSRLQCTYCGGEKFYYGPQGGMCVNVLCANEDCRHWFNYCPILPNPLEDLHRKEGA